MEPLSKRLAAEGLGTSFLLAVIIGSGIMGERLAAGNVAIALLANSLATGCALAALILVFGPISGGHFNPVVTLSMAVRGEVGWCDVAPYVLVQKCRMVPVTLIDERDNLVGPRAKCISGVSPNSREARVVLVNRVLRAALLAPSFISED